MRNRRAVFMAVVAVFTLSGGVAGCGTDQELLDKIDAANAGEANTREGLTSFDQTAQEKADEDARDAERARERRQELAALEKEQAAETERLMKEGVPGGNDEDVTIPIGSGDPEVQRFRARLAGICGGGQKRILAVADDAEEATKSKDPAKILAAAQAYGQALDDFLNALGNLEAPPSVRGDYRRWLGTINALASNIRLQLVSTSDPKKSRELQQKTTDLTTQLVEQSAVLGVTCLTATT